MGLIRDLACPSYNFEHRAMHCVVLLFCAGCIYLAAGDGITHHGAKSPSASGCNNTFQLVMVKSWLNSVERPEIVGVSARFGATLPRYLSEAVKGPALLTNPVTSCGKLASKGKAFNQAKPKILFC